MASYNYDIRRALPAELSAGGYGNYEAAQSLSAMAAQSVDPNLLQHENPNRCQESDLAPRLPLDQYRLNVDQNPHVIRRKPNEKVQYLQEIAVRYLKPPPPPRAGDIIIKEMSAKQVAPAPPLIVRQPGPKAPTPPPVCIRECPPQPPQPMPGKVIQVPGKVIPPPARKVIVERLPPIPPKPQQIFVERWLPFGEQRQRVIYEAAKPICQIPDPKNVVIQWDAPDVEVRREVKNLGVQQADPQDYLRRHGHQLVRADQLPDVAVKYAQVQGLQLAANARSEGIVLEGDVQALSLIDLDAHGLGYLRGRLSQSVNNLSSFSGANGNGNGAHSNGANGANGYHHQQQQNPSASLYDSYDSGVSHSYVNLNQSNGGGALSSASNGSVQVHAQVQAHYGSHQNLASAYSSEHVAGGHVGGNGGGEYSASGAVIAASSSSSAGDYNASIPGAYPCDDVPQQQHHHHQQQQQHGGDFPC